MGFHDRGSGRKRQECSIKSKDLKLVKEIQEKIFLEGYQKSSYIESSETEIDKVKKFEYGYKFPP